MTPAATTATPEQARPRTDRAERSCHRPAHPQPRYRKPGTAPLAATHKAQFGAAPTAWPLTRSAAEIGGCRAHPDRDQSRNVTCWAVCLRGAVRASPENPPITGAGSGVLKRCESHK
jgi:hypothetical protein